MENFTILLYLLMQSTVLHAARTDLAIMSNTPAFVALADFQMTKVWIMDVPLAAEDVLITIQTTLIILTVPPCAVAIIGELELHSLLE